MKPAHPIRTVLAHSPIFGGLPDDTLGEIARRFVPAGVEDGAYLFRAGDRPDYLYVLVEGELEVVYIGDDGNVVHLNSLGLGTVFGELAILRDEGRSASVRARGRCQVYRLAASEFLHLVRLWPTIALSVARSAADGFVRVERRAIGERVAPLFLVQLDDELDAELAGRLAEEIALHCAAEPELHVLLPEEAPALCSRGQAAVKVQRVAAPALAKQVAALRATAAALVVAGPEPFLESVRAQATALVSGDPLERPSHMDGTRIIRVSCSLPASRNVVRPAGGQGIASVVPRLARLLTGRTVGVALGGGAALGIANLGVLQALEELNVPVDFVAGTSMGAIVGAVYLSNGLERAVDLTRTLNRPYHWARLVDPSTLVTGMIHGARVIRFLREQCDVQSIESLPVPFAAVSFDIDTGEECVMQRGNLAEAVRASIGIPGIFTPFRPDGMQATLVDGGLVNNVPVDAVRGMGADRVVGIHVLARGHRDTPNAASGTSVSLPFLGRFTTLLQSQVMSMVRLGERQVFSADVAVTPDTSHFGFHEFWKGAQLVEAGRRAAYRLQPQLAALARPTRPGEGV